MSVSHILRAGSLFVISLAAQVEVNGAVTEQPALLVTCRVNNTNIPNVPIIVDSNYNPNGLNPNGDDWGSFTTYTEDDGNSNCNNNKYDFSQISIDEDWEIAVGAQTFNEASNRAYWNWTYTGYGDNPECDYSQNCHGYAYGVGDWPHSSEGIIEPGATPCWTSGDLKDCSVGDTLYSHTIQITPKDCSEAGWIVQETSEQFRESGTYTQECTCGTIAYMGSPPGVDYTKGLGERSGLTFTFLKEVSP